MAYTHFSIYAVARKNYTAHFSVTRTPSLDNFHKLLFAGWMSFLLYGQQVYQPSKRRAKTHAWNIRALL